MTEEVITQYVVRTTKMQKLGMYKTFEGELLENQSDFEFKTQADESYRHKLLAYTKSIRDIDKILGFSSYKFDNMTNKELQDILKEYSKYKIYLIKEVVIDD